MRCKKGNSSLQQLNKFQEVWKKHKKLCGKEGLVWILIEIAILIKYCFSKPPNSGVVKWKHSLRSSSKISQYLSEIRTFLGKEDELNDFYAMDILIGTFHEIFHWTFMEQYIKIFISIFSAQFEKCNFNQKKMFMKAYLYVIMYYQTFKFHKLSWHIQLTW